MSSNLEVSVFDTTSLLIVDKGFVRRAKNGQNSYVFSNEVFAKSSTHNYSFKIGVKLLFYSDDDLNISLIDFKVENTGHQLTTSELELFAVDQDDNSQQAIGWKSRTDQIVSCPSYNQWWSRDNTPGDTFILRFNNGVMFEKGQDLYRNGLMKEKFTLNRISKRANQCYEAGIGLDFTIKVGDRELKASKYALSQVSPVFEAMFTHEWKDSLSNRMDIDDFDYPEVEALVRLVHGLDFIPSDVELTIKLMLVADKYEVLELRDQCKDYLMNGLNQDNVMDTLIVAHQLGVEDIRRKALHVLTSRKFNSDKLFDGRTFPPDLWTLISKVIYDKMVKKL